MIRPVMRIAESAARTTAFAHTVAILDRATRKGTRCFTVLMYHRVDVPEEQPNLDPTLLSATPREFEEQMRFLQAHCHLVSLEELLAIRNGEARLRQSSVMITFDDAYRGFAEHAWPIMRALGVPVTLFVPTAYADGGIQAFWWDQLYGALMQTDAEQAETPFGLLPLNGEAERAGAFEVIARQLKTLPPAEVRALVDRLTAELGVDGVSPSVLRWDELRELRREGVVLAPHTRTHPMLDRLPLDEARIEMEGSHADLEREIGPTPRVLAYPAGAFTQAVADVLRESGFVVGFTTRRGTNDLRSLDWLLLRRINIGRRTNLALLRLQLLPWFARLIGADARSET